MTPWESFWRRDLADPLRAGSTPGLRLEHLVNGNAFTQMIKEGIFCGGGGGGGESMVLFSSNEDGLSVEHSN